MSLSQDNPCNVPLTVIPGTGYNNVAVPLQNGAEYKSITEQLLYEVWQSNLAILAALNPAGMITPITFTIGDGQAGTPANGTTSLHAVSIQGQNIVDKALLVIRNGIALNYKTPVNDNQIIRFNDHTNGGFDFTGSSGLSFQTGEVYLIMVIGTDTTVSP
jgi:hypothetical protein